MNEHYSSARKGHDMFTVLLGVLLALIGLAGICFGVYVAIDSGRHVLDHPLAFGFLVGAIILVVISLISLIGGSVILFKD